MDASNYMSPDEVERLVVYTYVYTYILYLSIYHTLKCMYDMILRPRIPRPHLGCNWSGSHVKSNPLPIELFSSIGRVLLSSYTYPGSCSCSSSSTYSIANTPSIRRQPALCLSCRSAIGQSLRDAEIKR